MVCRRCRTGRRLFGEARCPRSLLSQPPAHQRDIQRRRGSRPPLRGDQRTYGCAEEAGPVPDHAPGVTVITSLSADTSTHHDSQAHITIINHDISPDANGGQIHLSFMTVL